MILGINLEFVSNPGFFSPAGNYLTRDLVDTVIMQLERLLILKDDLLINRSQVRAYINEGILRIYDFFDKSCLTKYTAILYCTKESSGLALPLNPYLDFINLAAAVNLTWGFTGMFIPAGSAITHLIKSVTGVYSGAGLIQRSDMETITSLRTNENALYSNSRYWTHVDDTVHLFIGSGIPFDSVPVSSTAPDVYKIVINRYPILDDFTVGAEQNFIDLPSQHIRALMSYVMKRCYETVKEPIPENFESIITSTIQQVTNETQSGN
jgi:hypothetical protein